MLIWFAILVLVLILLYAGTNKKSESNHNKLQFTSKNIEHDEFHRDNVYVPGLSII